jgi:hypothetical protein
MRPLLLIPVLAVALLVPTGASARPILDPPIRTPDPALAPQPDDSPVGYVLAGLGGLALGAGGSLTLRRIA